MSSTERREKGNATETITAICLYCQQPIAQVTLGPGDGDIDGKGREIQEINYNDTGKRPCPKSPHGSHVLS